MPACASPRWERTRCSPASASVSGCAWKARGGRARPSPSAGRSGRWNSPTWPATPAPGAEDAEDQGRALASTGVDDYQGLRAYQPGDSRRRLHWKAFSRGQGLLVKDFAALGGEDLWLEFERLGGDLESRLGRLCHAVLELSARQQPYGLALPGTRLQPASGEAQREACLRALALFGAAR